MSNSADVHEPGEVHEDEVPEGREVRCSRCRGSGLVYVFDQETDCIDCEGYGTVIVYD